MKSYRSSGSSSSGNPSAGGQLWNTPSGGRIENSGDQSNLSQKLLYNKYTNNNNNVISSGGGGVGATGGSGHINSSSSSSQMDCDYSKLFYAKRKSLLISLR